MNGTQRRKMEQKTRNEKKKRRRKAKGTEAKESKKTRKCIPLKRMPGRTADRQQLNTNKAKAKKEGKEWFAPEKTTNQQDKEMKENRTMPTKNNASIEPKEK